MPRPAAVHPKVLPCPSKHTEYFRLELDKNFRGTSSIVMNDAEQWAKDQFDRLSARAIREKDRWLAALRCKPPCGPPQVVGDSVPSKTTTAAPIYNARNRHIGWTGILIVELGVEVDCSAG